MRPDDLIEYQREQPFQPFRIHLTDGTVYEIRHPELVKVGRSRADIYFPASDEPHAMVLRRESVALVHMIRLEPISEPAAGATP
jgi:hypothetical protein